MAEAILMSVVKVDVENIGVDIMVHAACTNSGQNIEQPKEPYVGIAIAGNINGRNSVIECNRVAVESKDVLASIPFVLRCSDFALSLLFSVSHTPVFSVFYQGTLFLFLSFPRLMYFTPSFPSFYVYHKHWN